MNISSAGKKILIVSDIHNDVQKLDKIIKHEAADINLVLGDWFDSFVYDDTQHYSKTAEYLLNYLSSPNNKTLFGNHDLHYLFHNTHVICSGYEHRKYNAIGEVLENNRLATCRKIDWFAWVDNYLCTHAGLCADFIDPRAKDISDINLFLIKERERANIKIISGDDHWFYAVGRARGGHYHKGGIVWLDFDKEFAPVEGLNQIVGHTPRRQKGITKYAGTENYCIDTFQSQWLTVANGKIEVKSYKDL
jgi:hypothetical protein